MNPADESALELALRLRPPSGTVTVFSVGPVEADHLLQDALAAGADAAVRVWDDSLNNTKPIVTTILLAAALRVQQLPDLVLCGGHSVDRGSGTVPVSYTHLDVYKRQVPMWSSEAASSKAPLTGTRPQVGLSPVTPLAADG